MMDSFSYCDISSVFTTKTIDRIISPMAVQLCHLIISLECDGNKYTVISSDVEQVAEELSKFTEHFANTSLRLGAECDDETLGKEMEKAAKSLLITGKSILLSVQKLSIQPAIQKHQQELVIAAQNVLMGTLKILQLEDDAGVRKIHQAADWLLECLTYLQKAESTSHLRSHFWEFSEAILLFNSLTENRIFDLKDSLHQKHLAQKLQMLRKCVPMLYTATQSSIKHPCNDQIINSKLYIFDQTSKTVQNLKHLLSNDPGRHDVNKQGSFAQEICHLVDILTDPKPTELLNSDLDFLVGAIIFYCMYVADCSRPNIKLQLVKHCQNFLEKRKRLCDHLKESQENPCGNKFELQEQCASMRVQLNHINENLISSIFYQILDAFTVKDPLKRLLRAALKINKKASLHSEHLFASKAFQPLLQAFQNHTDQLLKISSLVLAQCSQEQIIDEIQSSVDCLCRVRDEVVALVLDTNKAYYECKMLEKAQSIYQKWIQATESLIMSLDGILTVHQFLELSIKEIEEKKYHCEKLLRSQEPDIFQHNAADLCDLAERVVQVVTRHVDQSKSPVFRNGLRVLVRQLETSVLESRAAMIQCVEKISCFKSQNHFLEKVNHLFKSLHNVQEGVTGSKHPDLLSPLRNVGGPISHKVMTIDLNESEESKDYIEKNHREQHKKGLSYEGYLSKPVPLANTAKMIRNSANAENSIQVTDFQPLVGDLLSAIRKQNSKAIHACSSILHEMYSIYLEVANDASLHGNIVQKDELKYEDTKALILSLVQFKKKENIETGIEIRHLLKTATLLSHHIEEIKTYLISIVNFWYNFSYHLFCNSENTECATTNVELFNRLMQCFAQIVQLIREHLLYNYNDDMNITDLSENQEYVVKVHVKFSKCQASANRLLTEVLCCGIESENHRLEYVCILWAVSVQQLLRSLDVFIGINNLSITGPTDWTKLNISESKSLVLLCETSLWLQEAAVLSIHNFKEEKEQKKVLLLKEEMGSLTEEVLKLREELNTSSPSDLSFNVDCILLQMELMLKTKLLMDHMKKLYLGDQTLIQSIYFDIFSCSSSNRYLATRSFEHNAKILVEKITLVKETLKSSHCVTDKKELLLLIDHLYSLSNDIAARSRLLMDLQHEWDFFMLEAMLFNWSAKADQLISHIHSDTELDASVLKLITQCLRSGERTESTMTDPAVLESDTPNVLIQSMNVNVMEQRAATEDEQKNSRPREQDTNNGNSSVAVYKQIATYGDEQSEINSSDTVSSESGLISKEQSAIDGTQRKKLRNRQKSTVRRSIKVVRSKRGMATNDKHNKNFTEKHLKTLGVTLEKAISTETHDSSTEINIKRDNGKDSTNQNLHMYSGVENCLVNQELPTLTLDATVTACDKNLKTHTLLTVVKNRVSRQETMLHNTHKVLTVIQKETLNQELMNEKKMTENKQGISSEETKDQQRNRDSSMVQNEETSQEPKKVDTVHRGVQNKISNQKTIDRTGSQETNQEPKKIDTLHNGVQNKISNQKTRDQTESQETNQESKKIETLHNGSQNKISNQKTRDQTGSQETNQELKKIDTFDSGVQNKISNQKSKNQTGSQETNQEPKKIDTFHSRVQNKVSNQKTRNQTESQETNQEPKKIDTFHSRVQNTISKQKTRNQTESQEITRRLTETASCLGDQITVENLVTSAASKKGAKFSISEQQIHFPQTSTNDKMQLDDKEGQTEITKQGSTTANTYMAPTIRRKETLNKQKVTLNFRGQKKTDKEYPKLEIQNKQPISHKPEDSKGNETKQQIKLRKEYKTCPRSQPGMNILKMDYKKPVAISSDNHSSTTVIVEHAKVNCTSLKDVENVHLLSQSFAKCLLAEEVETWEGETNMVVKITREMATQMSYMMQYLDRKGPIKSPNQFIASAKYIATLGQTFVKFIEIMAKNCTDERNTCGLLCGMEQVQTISNQLNIISSVKAATGCDDNSAEDVLLKNAQNLIHSVLQTWKAAEVACIKSAENPIYSKEEEEVAAFCSQLRKKLQCQRSKETEY